jgi:hypothetical protein
LFEVASRVTVCIVAVHRVVRVRHNVVRATAGKGAGCGDKCHKIHRRRQVRSAASTVTHPAPVSVGTPVATGNGHSAELNTSRCPYQRWAPKYRPSNARNSSSESSRTWNSLWKSRLSEYSTRFGVEMISTPSGRSTRRISASILCSARCSSVSNETTQSKLASAKGMAVTLPVSNRNAGIAYLRGRRHRRPVDISRPVTLAAARAVRRHNPPASGIEHVARRHARPNRYDANVRPRSRRSTAAGNARLQIRREWALVVRGFPAAVGESRILA